jgi:O-antigen ligase
MVLARLLAVPGREVNSIDASRVCPSSQRVSIIRAHVAGKDRRAPDSRVITAGRWLLLAGLLFMVTGDGPSSTVRMSRWPTPLPFLAWPWLYLVLLVLGIACFIAGGGVKSWKPPHLRGIVAPLGALLATFLLSTITSQVHSLSATALLAVIAIALSCWMLAIAFEDERLSRAVWPTLAVAVLLLAVRVIVWRRDEGLNIAAFQVTNNFWLGKLQLAWVFNLMAPLLLARAMGDTRRRLAALYWFTWVVTGVAIYLLFSRMGSIVFAVTTFGVWMFNPRQWRKALVILIVALTIGAALVARSDKMSRFVITTILEPERDPGVEQRFGIWREALRMFRTRPITGTGLGTYDEVTYRFDGTRAEPFFRGRGWHAHNVYLHVLAETGALGLLAWCFFWYSIVARLLGAWKRADPQYQLYAAGALWAVLAFLVLSISEVLIGARVHASLRMNLTIGLVVVLGLHIAAEIDRRRSLH